LLAAKAEIAKVDGLQPRLVVFSMTVICSSDNRYEKRCYRLAMNKLSSYLVFYSAYRSRS
jgi:hypothetical protein